MAFKQGDEVVVASNGWVSNVVKQRLNDDIYLVRFDMYCDGSSLKLKSEADAEREASKPLAWRAADAAEEWKRLAPLLKRDLEDGKLSESTTESMTKLGIITKL